MVKKEVFQSLKAIGFDLDGTLLDSLILTMDAFWRTLKDIPQFTLTQQEFFNRWGPPEPVLFKLVLNDEKIAQKAFQDFEKSFCDHLDQVSLLPQIPLLLDSLKKRGIILGLITGRCRPLTEILIKRFDLEKYFSIIITGSELAHYKPHPEGMEKFLSTLSLPAHDVMFCGDTNADIAQAKQAGIKAGLVKWYWGQQKHDITTVPDIVFLQPAGLLNALP